MKRIQGKEDLQCFRLGQTVVLASDHTKVFTVVSLLNLFNREHEVTLVCMDVHGVPHTVSMSPWGLAIPDTYEDLTKKLDEVLKTSSPKWAKSHAVAAIKSWGKTHNPDAIASKTDASYVQRVLERIVELNEEVEARAK